MDQLSTSKLRAHAAPAFGLSAKYTGTRGEVFQCRESAEGAFKSNLDCRSDGWCKRLRGTPSLTAESEVEGVRRRDAFAWDISSTILVKLRSE